MNISVGTRVALAEPPDAGTVLKKVGRRVRVHLDGGQTKWFEDTQVTIVDDAPVPPPPPSEAKGGTRIASAEAEVAEVVAERAP